jgi:hypothetical protein
MICSRYTLNPAELDQPMNLRKAEIPGFCLKPRHEKLLDDTESLLYCDPELDRQFAIPLS